MASFLSRLLGRHDVVGAPPEPEQPKPVELDLGIQHEWEVAPIVDALRSAGCRLQMYAQSEHSIVSALAPRHCRILVHADDVEDVVAELTEAGFL